MRRGGVLRRGAAAPVLVEGAPGRPSLIARLADRGEGGPLLLQGHADVEPADVGEWSQPRSAA